ncbi:MAG TPA: TrmH family RNA methyltransferase [Gammaproteobacteria bacterium]|nr:TrmH family RNA methyltransferase [Gammaproteobacteria bacterium]
MNAGKQITGQTLFTQQQENTRTHTHRNAPVIICDGLQTPDNFGAILRIAEAAGSKKIILLDSDLDLKNRKLSKIARSTGQHLQIIQCNLSYIKEHRNTFKTLYALEITDQSENIFKTQISHCDAIMLGHEATGIREEALALCDKAIHLPMFGTNGSMNISHALAVCLYEWRRQQGV